MRLIPFFVRALVGCVTAATALGCSTTTSHPAGSVRAAPQPIDAALAVATFDSAWQRIADTHYDSTYGGVDWSGVRAELRPRAEAARDNEQLRAVLREMVSRLGESHFGVIPREASAALRGDDEADASQEGSPGFDIRFVDDRLLVTDVQAGSPAHAAGIRPGWALLRIGELDLLDALRRFREAKTELTPRMERLVAWQLASARLGGAIGSTVSVTMLDAADDTIRLDVQRAEPRGETVRVLALPPIVTYLEHERRRAPGGASVGVIRFNIWMAPIAPQFARAMDAHRDADGIIIDLRGNLGGLGAMAMGLSGHFIDTTLSLGTMRTRTTVLRFVSAPQRASPAGTRVRPYAGPLVILVDEGSVSTSEIFAAGMQAIGRARIVGDTTTGQALPARTMPLPNGDVLMHAFADFHDPHGERIEKRGVIPDVHATLDRRSLLRGEDPVLERALELVTRIREGEPGTEAAARRAATP